MAATKPLRQTTGEENGASPNGTASTLLQQRIHNEAWEIERDCRVAVACHANAARRWNAAYYVLGLPTAIFAALAGVSAINDQRILAAALAVAATVSAAANTFLNAGQTATAHAKKRSEYEQLKNEVRHFRNITMEHRPQRELLRELNSYLGRRDVLNLESPQVSSRERANAEQTAKLPGPADAEA
jgi:hypothetical protein